VRVKVSGRATRDLERLRDWLAPKSPAAANRAITAISQAILSLSELPGRGRLIAPRVRELRVDFGRDGYLLRYRVHDDEVVIARVFHGRERR